MASDLDNEFDREEDLNSAFDQEADLSAEFSEEAPMPVKADDVVSQQDSLWSQITEDLQPMSPSSVVGDVASIPSAVVDLAKQAPEEFERIKQQPAEATELIAKKMAQGASLAGPQHGLSAAYEKYVVAPLLDKIRGEQSLKEAATTWIPERYQDRSVEDIAAQNIARQKEQEAKFPVAATAAGFAGPAALQAVGIPIPATLGAQKAGEVLEETGRPIRALAEGSKAALLTELLSQAASKTGKMLKQTPSKIKQYISDKAALETAKSFGGTPATLAKIGKDRLIAAGEEAGPLVKGIKSQEKLRTELSERIKSLGSNLENNVDNISSELVAANPTLVKGVIDDITKNAQKSILAPLAENLGQTAESPAMFTISQKLRELQNLGRKTSLDVGVTNEAIAPTFKNLNEFKKALGNEVSSWEKAPHERIPDMATQRGLKSLYNETKQSLEDLANITGEKGVAYKQTKQSISRLKTLEKPAYEGFRQELQRDIVSDLPGSLRLPVRLAQYSLAPVTIPLELMHRAARAYGPQMSAQAFRGAEQAIKAIPQAGKTITSMAEQASKRIPGHVSQQLLGVIQTMPERLGQFALPLQKAAPRGSSALAATSYMLYQQYPEYRELLKKLEEEKE